MQSNTNMMEFEEMQKIWNEQKGENMYVINETAMHKNVTREKNTASRRISRLEIKLSIINSVTAIILLILVLDHPYVLGFIIVGLMAATVVYILYFRSKRKKSENTFNRTMLGEVDQAISNANSMIKLNYILVMGYLIPLSVLTVSSMIMTGAPFYKWLIIAAAFILSFFLFRWEQRACNIPRKKKLLSLKKKLVEE
jgi:Ca2+/Na+ antiporter